MRKDWLLLALSVVATLGLSLGLIRWLAPGLLGVPTDLQLVQLSKKVPPFYDNVFRPSDINSDSFLIPDPWLTRARPLFPDAGPMGPHDLLGFRNRRIPTSADIVTIGDSQTYGNNVLLEQNWPSQLVRSLGSPEPVVYNMSTGAWSGLEYLYMAERALAFRPQVVMIAFYAGNDPLGAFQQAYGNPLWSEFKVDPSLTKADAPKVNFPAPPEEQWQAIFPDGTSMVFTPAMRHSNSMKHPAVDAGWKILAESASRMAAIYKRKGTRLIITLIPTKEVVMAPRVQAAQLDAPEEYTALVRDETRRAEVFASYLKGLDQVTYIDLIKPLQQAALHRKGLYPQNLDGHPLTPGYRVIAETIAQSIDPAALRPSPGLYSVGFNPNEPFQFRLVTNEGWWLFDDPTLAIQNGWGQMTADGSVHLMSIPSDGRIFNTWPYLGAIDRVDRKHFGPAQEQASTAHMDVSQPRASASATQMR